MTLRLPHGCNLVNLLGILLATLLWRVAVAAQLVMAVEAVQAVF
jgi:hypothetical protein